MYIFLKKYNIFIKKFHYFNIMEAKFEKVPRPIGQSFYVNDMDRKYFPSPLHFHPEVEILYVLKGFGTRFVGNSVEHFTSGDLVLVGADIPHVWFSDSAFYSEDNDLSIRAIYIQFSENIITNAFSSLPELDAIRNLMAYASRGIKYPAQHNKDLTTMLLKIGDSTGFRRFDMLLNILYMMATSRHFTYLSHELDKNMLNTRDCERINKVYAYVMQHISEDITLQDIADKANMAPQSFCRYFKAHTHKTFSTFLNEIRISHACNMLKNSDLPVMDICFAAGYHHFSHFCSRFKMITGLTPLQYRKQYPTLFTKYG